MGRPVVYTNWLMDNARLSRLCLEVKILWGITSSHSCLVQEGKMLCIVFQMAILVSLPIDIR
jgi:hypothetical protein